MLCEMGEGREVVGAAVLHYEDAAGFEQVGAEDGGGDIGDAFELIRRVGEDEIKLAVGSGDEFQGIAPDELYFGGEGCRRAVFRGELVEALTGEPLVLTVFLYAHHGGAAT